MSLKFIKTEHGRKRFLKTQAIPDPNNWMGLLSEIKNFISLQSGLQIVGNSIYFELFSPNISPSLMLEVLGSAILEQNSFVLMDLENCEILVHKLQDFDLFTLDFDQLFQTSWDIKRRLESNFIKNGVDLSNFFHIVFNHDKIELHFFRQKDYIQNCANI